MKHACLEVLTGGAHLFRHRGTRWAYSEGSFAGIRARTLSMFANTHRTLLRIEALDSPVRSQEQEWELFKSAFPFGERLNESSHIFDYTVVENSGGEKRALLAAIPAEFSDSCVRLGKEITRSIHRIKSLDFVENLILKKFAALSQNGESFLIVLPQDNGFRLLSASRGLPVDVYFISNHPDFRAQEFLRFWRCSFFLESVSATVVLFATRTHGRDGHAWLGKVCEEIGAKIIQKNFHLPQFLPAQLARTASS